LLHYTVRYKFTLHQHKYICKNLSYDINFYQFSYVWLTVYLQK